MAFQPVMPLENIDSELALDFMARYSQTFREIRESNRNLPLIGSEYQRIIEELQEASGRSVEEIRVFFGDYVFNNSDLGGKEHSDQKVREFFGVETIHDGATYDQLESDLVHLDWRDIFHLDIEDPVLREQVEAYLDFLQSAQFDSGGLHDAADVVFPEGLNGQALFGLINNHRMNLMTDPEAQGLLHDEKITIEITDDRGFSNNVIFAETSEGSTLPVRIQISSNYLQSAGFTDGDNRMNPVSLERALTGRIVSCALSMPTLDDLPSPGFNYSDAHAGEPIIDNFTDAIMVALGEAEPVGGYHVSHFNQGVFSSYPEPLVQIREPEDSTKSLDRDHGFSVKSHIVDATPSKF